MKRSRSLTSLLLALGLGSTLLPACAAQERILAQLTRGQKTRMSAKKVERRKAKAPEPPASPKKADAKVRFTSRADRALAAARRSNGKVLLILTGEYCPPCHDMRDNVFPRADVRKALGSYVVLADKTGINFRKGLRERVDAGGLWGSICEEDGSAGTPTLAIFDGEGRLLKKNVGWMNAEDTLAFLR